MKTRSIFKNSRVTAVTSPLLSAVAALAVVVLILLAFAFLISKIDAKDFTLSVMSTIALAAGAYVGGYISGKRRKHNGLLMGTLCGVFIFLIILLLGAFFSKTVESFPASAKLVITIVCAAAGGVVGVNSKSS